jgi:hypothetical protein
MLLPLSTSRTGLMSLAITASGTPALTNIARTPPCVFCSKVQRVTADGLAITAIKDSGGSK